MSAPDRAPRFHATKADVLNRGVPPDSFLGELLDWGIAAPDEIFAPNANDDDIYSLINGTLGPWTGLLHRRAALLEAMRVHAGFESSWRWTIGVDVTNHTSMTHLEGQETGIFQVSFNSTWLGKNAMAPFARAHGISSPPTFIAAMKKDHKLALEYYARLVRVNIKWAGPLVRHEILPCLSRKAMEEFQVLLAS